MTLKKDLVKNTGYNEDTGEKNESFSEIGIFYDLKTEEEVFNLSNLYMIDANGRCSEPLDWQYIDSSEGYLLSVNLDDAFLIDPLTEYPVVVDPTIQGPSVTFDAFASSTHPSTPYYLSSYVRTGKDTTYGKRRTFIKWTLPSIANEYPIASAEVQLKKYTSSGSTNLNALKIYTSWTSSTLTWWNSPNCDTDHQVAWSSWNGDWQILDLSMIMRRWDCGLYTNYGIKIYDDQEESTSVWTTFYSSDYATTSYGPKLVIILYTGNTLWENKTNNGYESNVIYVHNILDTYANQFQPALQAWNYSDASCYIASDNSSNNGIYDFSSDQDWYGLYFADTDPAQAFIICLNTRTIDLDKEWDGFARDVLIHELGHALWLADMDHENYCIMGRYRDRDTMLFPTESDIAGVNNYWN